MQTNFSKLTREGLRFFKLGEYENALNCYLWCWDHGYEPESHFGPVRRSFLLIYLRGLADVFPVCDEAMRSRKEQLQAGLRDPGATEPALRDLAALKKHGF